MSAIRREVVTLIRQQRWEALATVENGRPLASMVAYAVEPRLEGLLFFVSRLSAHTQHLLESPVTSLAVTAPDTGEGDPQLLPRVSLSGRVTTIARDDGAFAEAAGHYVERLPDAAPRFQLGDFILFRFTIEDARYVGGFARASRFTGDQLRDTAAEMDGGAAAHT